MFLFFLLKEAHFVSIRYRLHLVAHPVGYSYLRILCRKVIVMATNHPVDLALVEAYLHNLQLALLNDQPRHAELLLAHVLQLMAPALTSRYPALLPT